MFCGLEHLSRVGAERDELSRVSRRSVLGARELVSGEPHIHCGNVVESVEHSSRAGHAGVDERQGERVVFAWCGGGLLQVHSLIIPQRSPRGADATVANGWGASNH